MQTGNVGGVLGQGRIARLRSRPGCCEKSSIDPNWNDETEWRCIVAGIIMRPGQGETLNVLGMPLRFLCDATDTQGAWSLMEEEIALGQGPAAHRHDWDEAYFVIDGALDFEIDGEVSRLGPRDFAYLPRNTVHAFKGASASPAHVLIFAAPAHASDFFKEVNREVQKVPDDLPKLPSIGQRHGIEFMPPKTRKS
jgi:quercetin dioxygenase-like cupin family protein